MKYETEVEILRRTVKELHTIAGNLAYSLNAPFDAEARLKNLRAWDAYVLRSPEEGALMLIAKRMKKEKTR